MSSNYTEWSLWESQYVTSFTNILVYTDMGTMCTVMCICLAGYDSPGVHVEWRLERIPDPE